MKNKNLEKLVYFNVVQSSKEPKIHENVNSITESIATSSKMPELNQSKGRADLS